MIVELVVIAAAVAYGIYKHVTVAQIEADVKAAVAKVEVEAASVEKAVSASSVIATIRADLAKYL